MSWIGASPARVKSTRDGAPSENGDASVVLPTSSSLLSCKCQRYRCAYSVYCGCIRIILATACKLLIFLKRALG
ncbi:hypothetical protein MA20_46565 [Bradyrhizobium japonicum]|uniref:Uncharacterized protein n=1 Tax=Bradyrhizobium japonicum TaxID=375 RepID=A0A0A3YHB8_BRAJP|nr:hypothetical protein MA20_46565 [Bradyrhizobium japonicum]